MHQPADQLIRIGDLSRRTGVAPELIRAWERRYDLLTPQRSGGGFRLYTSADVERVIAMTTAIGDGLPASLAAKRVTGVDAAPPPPQPTQSVPPAQLRDELAAALDAFDEVGANTVVDRALAEYSLDTFLGALVMPYLLALGTRWQDGQVTIAQEHFATSIVRGRLLGLARGWGTGDGRLALLACPSGEQHDLGLISFGLVLRQQGWRIVLVGPNTPVATLGEAADRLGPALVVVAAMQTPLLESIEGELAQLAARHRLALAGPGATAHLTRRTGAWLISESPVDGAIAVARDITTPTG